MPLTLSGIPGFADIPNNSLSAEAPALAMLISRIAQNAEFGMIRPEVFSGLYKHGDTVNLPQSSVDGYVYDRTELIYLWATQSTMNPSSGWITGPDSLWYCQWGVDQNSGAVTCIEYYRRSGSNDQGTQSNDGTLRVFTIAQRLKVGLDFNFMANVWTDIPDSSFVTDAPLAQTMARTLNQDAKFSILNSEVIYMGEFKTGDTVPLPTSPVDGYAYSYSQVQFQASWRWTSVNTAFTQVDKAAGQMGPMKWSINPTTGAVTVSISWIIDSNTIMPRTDYGRIAVVAFCSRASLIGTLPAVANGFAEIASNVFVPGKDLRASSTLQLMKNIREAACSCEFFSHASYHNGDTVALPTSPIDGYTYTRDEITCVWEWDDTTNQTGTHLRVAALWADVSQTTGFVTLRNWRLADGGPYVESDSFSTIKVAIVAQRGAQHATVTSGSANPASDIGSASADTVQPNNSPYAIPYYAGQTNAPAASENILKHVIPGDVASVTLPLSLTGSYGGCITAPTGSISITVKKAGTTLGTLNIAAGATTMTFTWSAAVTLSPGDILDFFAPGTADSTLAGIYFTLAGTRT